MSTPGASVEWALGHGPGRASCHLTGPAAVALEGLRVMGKALPDRAMLTGVVDTALDALAVVT